MLQASGSHKETGVDWLGKVPSHWEVARLKVIFDVEHGSTPRTSEPAYWDGDIAWVTPNDLGRLKGHTINETERKITEAGYESCGTVLVPAGSLVLSTRAPIGHLAIAGVPLCTNQGCHSLVFRAEGSPRYFYYLLRASRQELESWGQGSTFSELSRGKLGNVLVVKPPLPEQEAISNFLDHRTNLVDSLIERKLRQIELLQERHDVLVTQTVTKGLDKTIRLKDSGVEWLGEIPESWGVLRSKFVFSEVDERSESGQEELLTVSHITGVTKRSEKNVNMFLAESLEGYKKCEAGDLIINTMWAWMGALGVSKHDGVVSPSYNVYRFRAAKSNPWFYDHLFRTKRFIGEIRRYSKGVWESRLRLYPSDFFEIRIPCPDEKEQAAIASYLDRATEQVDIAVARIRKSIDNLREYREAMITAVATGKVDIRTGAS